MRTAHPNGAHVANATPEGLVCVARDEDDPRSIYIPIDALVNPHVATDCGGRLCPLTRPTLAGYMERDRIPVDMPFGHTAVMDGAGSKSSCKRSGPTRRSWPSSAVARSTPSSDPATGTRVPTCDDGGAVARGPRARLHGRAA